MTKKTLEITFAIGLDEKISILNFKGDWALEETLYKSIESGFNLERYEDNPEFKEGIYKGIYNADTNSIKPESFLEMY